MKSFPQIAVSFLLAFHINVVADGQSDRKPTEGSEERFKKLSSDKQREYIQEQLKQARPNHVCGYVTDTEGNALPGVSVTLSWLRTDAFFGGPRNPIEEHVVSDSNGQFMFICTGATSGYIRTAEKVSYVCVSTGKGNSVELFGSNKSWTKDNPVEIVMRKRGPATFLIVSPNANHLPDTVLQTKGTNSVSRPLDLLSWKSDPGWKYSATTNAELRIDAVFDAEKKCWNITYSVTNGPGGLVLSDSMLYEAPADGYAPSVAVTVTNVHDWRRYLYVKSREPAVYSRVLFEHSASVGANPSLRVSCKAWVNPYGERNLEYDDRLEDTWRVREALTAEAIQAIRSKRLPPKPEIAQRIKEMNVRVAREEAEKDRRHREWVEQQKKEKEPKEGG